MTIIGAGEDIPHLYLIVYGLGQSIKLSNDGYELGYFVLMIANSASRLYLKTSALVLGADTSSTSVPGAPDDLSISASSTVIIARAQ